MIAANYRKYPDAMAVQLVLRFGRALVWATKRPTTDALRMIRALRGAAFKAAGRILWPVKPTRPAWMRDSAKKARKLAAQVKRAQRGLLDVPADSLKGYAGHVAWCREQFSRYTFVITA